MKRMQHGITMLGFLMVLCLGIFFAYCGMKIGPMYMEYYSVQQALRGLSEDTSLTTAPKDEIRKMFARRLNMSYALNVKPDTLKFQTADGGLNMVVDYERRESLMANLDVVGKFHAEHLLKRGAAGSGD